MTEQTAVSSLLARAFILAQKLRSLDAAEIPAMRVTGDFTDGVDILQRTAMTMLLLPGKVDATSDDILTPFVHLHVQGTEDGVEDKQVSLLRQIVPFENASFLVSSLATDIRIACDELVRVTSADRRIERARLQIALKFMSQAAHETLTSVGRLAEVLDGGDVASHAPSASERTSEARPRE